MRENLNKQIYISDQMSKENNADIKQYCIQTYKIPHVRLYGL